MVPCGVTPSANQTNPSCCSWPQVHVLGGHGVARAVPCRATTARCVCCEDCQAPAMEVRAAGGA
jgi:hypothetical protein